MSLMPSDQFNRLITRSIGRQITLINRLRRKTFMRGKYRARKNPSRSKTMQLVVKNGTVLAYHQDGQDLYPHYPDCEIFDWVGPKPDLGDPDPRTKEQADADRWREDDRRKLHGLRAGLPELLWLLAEDQRDGTTKFSDRVFSEER